MIFSDVERGDVRQRAFQSVADLDVHFAVAFKNEQDHAVALLFLSDAPRLRDPLSVIFDRGVALHFRKHRDHDLIGSLALELGQLLVEAQRGFF